MALHSAAAATSAAVGRAATRILILPGFQNSGPLHWQSIWEQQQTPPLFPLPVSRVHHSSWDEPEYARWQAELEDHILNNDDAVNFLVCHSLGCLNALSLSVRAQQRVSGALFVAPANPTRPNFPKQISGFPNPLSSTIPLFPVTVVCSADDPYASVDWAEQLAQHLGVAHKSFFNIGPRGHINADSRLGQWEFGLQLVRSKL